VLKTCKCTFNLHQCHIALLAYAGDYNNYPPNIIHAGGQFWQGIQDAATDQIGAATRLVNASYLKADVNYNNWMYVNPKAARVTMWQ